MRYCDRWNPTGPHATDGDQDMTTRLIGDTEFSVHATAYAFDGRAINGGNLYADFRTMDAARECAGRLFASAGGCPVAKVSIHGGDMVLGYQAWRETGTGHVWETVKRPADLPITY